MKKILFKVACFFIGGSIAYNLYILYACNKVESVHPLTPKPSFKDVSRHMFLK